MTQQPQDQRQQPQETATGSDQWRPHEDSSSISRWWSKRTGNSHATPRSSCSPQNNFYRGTCLCLQAISIRRVPETKWDSPSQARTIDNDDSRKQDEPRHNRSTTAIGLMTATGRIEDSHRIDDWWQGETGWPTTDRRGYTRMISKDEEVWWQMDY